MSNSSNQAAPPSRFTPQNKTTHERLTTHTVGLVHLSDFRKRRAEVLEQQEREARDAVLATPDRSLTGTPTASDTDADRVAFKNKKKKRKIGTTHKLSFAGDEEEEEEEAEGGGDEGPTIVNKKKGAARPKVRMQDGGDDAGAEEGADEQAGAGGKKTAGKMVANASVGVAPRAMTKSAMRREAAERDALRKEFLLIQTAVKATEVAIPFVFYDGSNLPGGMVRVRKGDFIWVFLDKSRKVGAELSRRGEKAMSRKEWARVGVDDLLLVRGTIIIPHHYEFYFFVMNKTVGPDNQRLFNYRDEAPTARNPGKSSTEEPLSTTDKALPPVNTLEGSSDDPTFTKVVDRRWYERNKHIYPASVWQAFDPEKNYTNEIRRDTGGNTFFYS